MQSILESKACAKSHSNIAALKASLTSAWDYISEQVMHDSCAQLQDRLRGVIKTKGGYVEDV